MDDETTLFVRTRAGQRCEYCRLPQRYHFTIERGVVRGRTAIGRTTVYVLNMNTERRIELRLALRDLEGSHWWRR